MIIRILLRLCCLLVGYLFGLFPTAYLFGKSKGKDIRNEGSGNPGATNTMRVFGFSAGVLVFIGDVLKTVIPCLIVRLLADHFMPEMAALFMLYTAFGVMLGHDYPAPLEFRGGKGIACTGGLILVINPLVGLVLLGIFLIFVLATHYVSVGSFTVVIGVALTIFFYALTGRFGLTTEGIVETCILAVIIAVMAFYRHRENIDRLSKGKENKTYFFKKNKKE